MSDTPDNRSANVIPFPSRKLLARTHHWNDPSAVSVLPHYDQRYGMELLADLFVLRMDDDLARCQIRTHPDGWELRLIVGGRSSFEMIWRCRTQVEVFEISDAWKHSRGTQGWLDITPT